CATLNRQGLSPASFGRLRLGYTCCTRPFTSNSEPRMANRWGILAALSFARVGMGFQFQTVAATAPLLSDRLGFDRAQIGWLIGLYLLPGVLVALPGGMLGARFGDKRMALIGL